MAEINLPKGALRNPALEKSTGPMLPPGKYQIIFVYHLP